MERTPKQRETIEFGREVLTIDQRYRLRAFRHGRRVRIEVELLNGQPVLVKSVEIPIQERRV